MGLLLLSGACASDTPDTGEATGFIAAKVKADGTVRDAVPATKALATVVPDASAFSLTLTKADGSFSSSWASVNDFPVDLQFATGAYTIEASYGAVENEGFDCPYYYGVNDIHVIEGETTETEITATLANTMVSLEYTDAFRNYFSAYTGQLHAAGGDFIEMTADETRPAYLRPGQTTVTLSITKQNGVSATIEAAQFEALARHHYHITLDVNNGQTGEGTLVVMFDDSIVEEDVEIDMSDSFLLAPAPVVTAKGFEDGGNLSIYEGTRLDQASFVVSAAGGLKAVTLTTQSAELQAKGFPAEIDLMSATAEQQELLKGFGLEVQGLWNGADKMAVINMAGLIATLTATGSNSFALVAKDKLGKVNLPVTLNVNTSAVDMTITDLPDVYIDATQASLTATYSGVDFSSNVSLELQNAAGDWQNTSYTVTAGDGNSYSLSFAVPSAYRDVPVRLVYNGRVKATGTVNKRGVILTAASADIWATHATLSIEKNASIPYSSLKFYASSNSGDFTELTSYTIDEANHTVTFTGLTPGTAYSVKGSDTGAYAASYRACAVNTESALQPENNSMDSWSQDSGWSKKAGIYSNTVYQYFPSATASANEYWATRNALTTCQNFGYTSMWYNYYSGTYGVTGVSGQAAEICTVGYARTAANTFAPVGGSMAGSVCNKTDAGYLFMGSYTYDHDTDQETFTYGRPFTSRPAALTFYYKFTSVESENFKAYVVVENRNGNTVTELGRGELISNESKSDFTQATINIKYTNKSLKATHAYIVFVSSTADSPSIKPVTGSKGAFAGYTDARFTGNILDVDNILFTY